MRDWRPWVPAMLFAGGVVLVATADRQSAVPLQRPLKTLPSVIAGVQGTERALTEDEIRVVGFTDHLFRIFRKDSLSAFSVYVGYYESQVTGKTIHSPKNCLPGSGWQVVESAPVEVPMGDRRVTVNQYIIANGPSQAVVYYWYQGRGRVAHSEYKVKWELLRDAATRGRTEEALVRVVVPIPPGRSTDPKDWRRRREASEAVAARVSAELLPLIESTLPTWTVTA